MKKILLTLTMILALSFATSAMAATSGTYNGHDYLLVFGTTWSDAQNDAQNTYGSQWNLVTIDDQAENDWLQATFLPDVGLDKFWIGYENNGTGWKWADGSSSTFTNWETGFPELSTPAYGTMTVTGEWISIPNTTADSYSPMWGIAEAVAPEPLSAVLFLMGGAGLVVARRRKKKV